MLYNIVCIVCMYICDKSVTTMASEVQMEIPEQLFNLLRAGAILLLLSEV